MRNGLMSLCSALRWQGGLIPTEQAYPLSKGDLLRFLDAPPAWVTPDVELAFLICWKAAARWTEVAALGSGDFLVVEDDRIVVDYGMGHKAAKASGHPFREDRWAVLTGDLVQRIARLLRRRDMNFA
eukprot:TRINITY_DN12521_c0_g1_i2.p3 TRINITY_DN12521_c0_g1~~TRINITY_DN12521_c0_g1_i2.p3  ORF type:complete len:127 (-),score=39.95 TRINITY_DN12521_c0_g1_i2:8-388(-)